jgi:transcriptional regulator with XRE-family HTH domain
MITADQIRAARALLQFDQTELARRAHVSLATLRRSENGSGAARVSPRAVASIQHALEAAGVEFFQDGVRRRRRCRTPAEREALFRDIMAIAHRSAKLAAENPGFSEEDLYDESGLPA